MADNVKGIKALVGSRQNKNHKFMDQNVTIQKLTYAEVMQVKELAQGIENDDAKGFELLKFVVRKGTQGGDDLTDDDFQTFPLDELSGLSSAIMKHSGIAGDQAAGK